MDGLRSKAQNLVAEKDTTRLRRSLETDLREINEPRKVLKSYDIYTSAHKQHKTNILTAAGIGTTSLSIVISIVQSATDLAKNCPPGTNGSSSLSCELSAENVIGAAFGFAGASVSAKLLYDGRSHVEDVKAKMDTELATKLARVRGKKDLVEGQGQELVSRFARLSIEDQKQIRDLSMTSTSEPVDPSGV